MVYTEIQERQGKKYYYRVKSVRKGNKISKERVYLGVNLNKKEIAEAVKKADKKLNALNNLLSNEDLNFIEKIKKIFLQQPKENFESRYESFCAQFTYNSNAIEGNTLTLQETAQLLFENIVPAAKSVREIKEALNHKQAFDYILSYTGDMSKKLMLDLHKIVVNETLDDTDQIGTWRKVQVYIRGVEWLPPKPAEVPREIKSLLAWYSKNKNKLHPLIVAAYFHVGFETIHPFVDGNGRVGRLLINVILRKNKLPMINIPHAKRIEYYKALEEAQTKGNLKAFVNFLLQIYKENKLYI